MVLILVLLEYARRHQQAELDSKATLSLNPCFTGICSPTQGCCQGSWIDIVLILVLLEYARRRMIQNILTQDSTSVLILVLLEYARRLSCIFAGLVILFVLILVLLEYARRRRIQLVQFYSSEVS